MLLHPPRYLSPTRAVQMFLQSSSAQRPSPSTCPPQCTAHCRLLASCRRGLGYTVQNSRTQTGPDLKFYQSHFTIAAPPPTRHVALGNTASSVKQAGEPEKSEGHFELGTQWFSEDPSCWGKWRGTQKEILILVCALP